MAKYHGKNARLYIGGYDISPLVSVVTPEGEKEMAQYAVQDGSDAYHSLPGLARSTLKLEGLFDDNYQAVLNSLWAAAAGYQIVILFGLSLGDRALAGTAVRLGKHEWKAVITDVNKLSADLLLDDSVWDECKILQPKTQITGAYSGPILDEGAPSASGAIGYCQVFEQSDTWLEVKIRHSTDNFVADDTELLNFGQFTQPGTARVIASGTIKRYLRSYARFIDGSPYTGTFAIVFKRN